MQLSQSSIYLLFFLHLDTKVMEIDHTPVQHQYDAKCSSRNWVEIPMHSISYGSKTRGEVFPSGTETLLCTTCTALICRWQFTSTKAHPYRDRDKCLCSCQGRKIFAAVADHIMPDLGFLRIYLCVLSFFLSFCVRGRGIGGGGASSAGGSNGTGCST